MPILGSSLIVIKDIPTKISLVGATGPTGPIGPTGSTGPIGATGLTGIGIHFITKIDNNGITVHLTDELKISVTGISGNAPTDFTTLAETNPYDLIAATGASPMSFYLGGGALGLTAYFKSIKPVNGLSMVYSNNDLVFKGVTSSSYALGLSGSVLMSLGNTASPIIDVNGDRVFRYQTVTSGITTQHLATAVLGAFYQTKSSQGITNVNLLNVLNITDHVQNFYDASVNYFYVSGNTWESKQVYHSTFGVVTGANQTIGITFNTSPIFNTSNTTKFGDKTVGSCCYCDDNDGKKTCKDYVNKSYCETVLGGIFSFKPCSGRRIEDCDDFGACCINGICVNTTKFVCEKFGGNFDASASCSALPPPCG